MYGKNKQMWMNGDTACMLTSNEKVDLMRYMEDDLITSINTIDRPELNFSAKLRAVDKNEFEDELVVSNIYAFCEEQNKSKLPEDSFRDKSFLEMSYIPENPIVLMVNGSLMAFPTAEHAWLGCHTKTPEYFTCGVTEYNAVEVYDACMPIILSLREEAKLIEAITRSKFFGNPYMLEWLMKTEIESFCWKNRRDSTLGAKLSTMNVGGKEIKAYIGLNFLGIALNRLVAEVKPHWDRYERFKDEFVQNKYNEILGTK